MTLSLCGHTMTRRRLTRAARAATLCCPASDAVRQRAFVRVRRPINEPSQAERMVGPPSGISHNVRQDVTFRRCACPARQATPFLVLSPKHNPGMWACQPAWRGSRSAPSRFCSGAIPTPNGRRVSTPPAIVATFRDWGGLAGPLVMIAGGAWALAHALLLLCLH